LKATNPNPKRYTIKVNSLLINGRSSSFGLNLIKKHIMQIKPNQFDQPSFSKWLKLFGVVFLVIGIFALMLPVAASIAIEFILGWLFFTGGVVQLGTTFLFRKSNLFWFKLAWALLFLVVGVWLILRPAEGVEALAFVVGILFLVEAILKIAFYSQRRTTRNIGWTLVSGICSFFIGIILISGWPQQSAILLGLLIGINLIFNGIVALTLSFGTKALDQH
jgi:uncharacterized membrane protein HdeD (DUF308 family)